MRRKIISATIFIFTLASVGAGCAQKTVVNQPKPSVNTTNQPTPTITVAAVVLEGTKIPTGAKVIKTKVGCNDTVVTVDVPLRVQNGNPIANALMTLFANPQFPSSDYYSGLTQSVLNVLEINKDAKGVTEVYLSGTLISGGVCDDPRIKAQIETTIAQYVKSYRIYLNGSTNEYKCIGDESGKCK